MGLVGFILSGVAGAFSPLIAVVITIVFTVLILRKKGSDPKMDDDAVVF